jgi:excisionase family DNA binding protein
MRPVGMPVTSSCRFEAFDTKRPELKSSVFCITAISVGQESTPETPALGYKDVKQDFGRIASRKPEIAQISAVPSHTSDNLVSEKQVVKRQSQPNPSVSNPSPRCCNSRRILTPVDAAELLSCDGKTITRWARNGYLPAHPIGEGKKRYWRFFEDELIVWLEAQTNGFRAA